MDKNIKQIIKPQEFKISTIPKISVPQFNLLCDKINILIRLSNFFLLEVDTKLDNKKYKHSILELKKYRDTASSLRTACQSLYDMAELIMHFEMTYKLNEIQRNLFVRASSINCNINQIYKNEREVEKQIHKSNHY